MNLLHQKIHDEGRVREEHILKVDSFLNHQLDVDFLNEVGKEFYKRFKNKNITKILTIEASGIAIASITAQYFKVPVVFAKKTPSKNIDGKTYNTLVHSYTKNIDYNVQVAEQYINEEDCILILDDFLANGQAALGLVDLVNQGNAKLAGVGIVIEKAFQTGGQLLRDHGVHLESLAVINSLKDNKIEFEEEA